MARCKRCGKVLGLKMPSNGRSAERVRGTYYCFSFCRCGSSSGVYLAHFVMHREVIPWSSNWMRHIGGSMTIAQALLILVPFFPALTTAALVRNLGIYLIAPARRAMDAEDRNYPGTDYKTAQKALSQLTLYTAPVALILMLLGAWWLSITR